MMTCCSGPNRRRRKDARCEPSLRKAYGNLGRLPRNPTAPWNRPELQQRSRRNHADAVILPDVYVLVQAFRADTAAHALCRRWLTEVINGPGRYGMSTQVLSGVIRITTRPKVFIQPSALSEVLRFCAILLDQPHCVVVHPGASHWEIFAHLCTVADARGNLVSDAWFAALAMEWGCDWVTLDRDYARFPGLRWRLPE